MRRLWILNHYAAGPGDSGGTRHYDLARQLVSMGWDVSIMAASFNHQQHRDDRLLPGEKMSEEVRHGVRFVWLRTPAYYDNGWRRIWNMLVFTILAIRLGWSRERPGVIIGSSVHLFAVWAAFVLAKHHRCRFVFEVRDLWPQTLIDIGKVSEKHPVVWVLRRLELFLYRRADRIIVLLSRASEYMVQFGIPAEKIFYLPNGVNLARYHEILQPLDVELEKLANSLTGKFVTAYTGTLGMANSLDTLLDAAAILKQHGNQQIQFLIVGNGPEKTRLIQRTAQEQLINVTFVDPLPKDYIPFLLSQVNTGIHSFQDSPVFQWGVSPNKIFDYMAAGLPVIFLCNRAYSNPVTASGGGYVLPGEDAPALARALLDLAEQPEHAAALGQKARAYVEHEHSMEMLGPRLASILSFDSSVQPAA
ncbi:MAG: hypothetical protein JL56_14175 [Desulfotomaculum sp. BICA1-6]|nr:MAG: hypothetical protein VR67_10775 [Peptococcaceae bacterium BRH_c8a]KJS71826.1 MAG: hypothetical protein JL56_14175 [Desulfotomaculum sp. BICA1-6]